MAVLTGNAWVEHTGGIGTDTYSKRTITTYTDGTRPAAAALKDVPIYNSTVGKHQISDGVSWYTIRVDLPYASPAPLTNYTNATRPAATIANVGTLINNTSTGYIEQSTGTAWSQLGTTLDEAAEALLGVGPTGAFGTAAPARITTRATSTTVYVDPTGGAGSGTLGSPRNTIPTTTVAGTAYLIKQGTTLTQNLSLNVNGSSGNPIVIGVYASGTGTRVSTLAAATLNGWIDITGDYVTVDGLSVTADGGGNSWRVQLTDADNCQLLNVRANGGANYGIRAQNCNSLQMDGCEANNSYNSNFYFRLNNSTNVTGLRCQYSTFQNSGRESGIFIDAANGDARLQDSEVAVCNCSYNANSANAMNGDGYTVAGIAIGGNVSALRIYRNTFDRNLYAGVRMRGYIDSPPKALDGLNIENNYFRGSSMQIHFTDVQGKWSIRRNKMVDAGTNVDNKSTQANPVAAYGRAIELFCDPKTTERRTSDGGIQMNAIYGAVAWDAWITEGIGLGLDDWTGYVMCWGNWVRKCEGSAVQFNTNKGSVVFANVFADNCKRPTANRVPMGYLPAFAMRSEVGGSNSDCLTIANAIVSGRESDAQQGGMSDYGGTGFEYHGNLVSNSRVGANLNGSSTRTYNRYIGCDNPIAASYDQNFPPPGGTVSTGEVIESSAISATADAYMAAQGFTLLTLLPYAGAAPATPSNPAYSRPTADITTGWQPSVPGAPLYSMINEASPSSAEFIYASAGGQTAEVQMQAMSTPVTGSNLVVNYTVQSLQAGASVTVSLYDNTTLIKTDTARTVNGQYAMTVSAAEWAGVSSWTNIRLRFVSG